jgi:tRNA threonylcarbamoyladenosine biosynthesis protein TsaB
MVMEPRLLVLETSSRVGQVALAEGERLLGVRRLDQARRHARDLAPAIRDLLAEHAWRAADLHGVIVSRGPGSYTGLRVGLMSAKTLAYATGCALLAVETFAAIARQAPPEPLQVDVLADAQQGKVYVQRFERASSQDPITPRTSLAIQAFNDWIATLEQQVWVTGPGVRGHESDLTGGRVVESELWDPQAESVLQIGLERYRRGERDDFWRVEPLYLRPSAAEENWPRRQNEVT